MSYHNTEKFMPRAGLKIHAAEGLFLMAGKCNSAGHIASR